MFVLSVHFLHTVEPQADADVHMVPTPALRVLKATRNGLVFANFLSIYITPTTAREFFLSPLPVSPSCSNNNWFIYSCCKTHTISAFVFMTPNICINVEKHQQNMISGHPDRFEQVNSFSYSFFHILVPVHLFFLNWQGHLLVTNNLFPSYLSIIPYCPSWSLLQWGVWRGCCVVHETLRGTLSIGCKTG